MNNRLPANAQNFTEEDTGQVAGKGVGTGDDHHTQGKHTDKQSPMAVSEDNLDRWVMTVMPPIMKAAPIAAPIIPGKPTRKATAIPGNTP